MGGGGGILGAAPKAGGAGKAPGMGGGGGMPTMGGGGGKLAPPIGGGKPGEEGPGETVPGGGGKTTRSSFLTRLKDRRPSLFLVCEKPGGD